MSEHVVLFAGPMGSGKTTAIRSLSEIDVVSTEATNTDRETADKETTTVALDYGEITIDDVTKVRLYGVPGQKRFDFMWSILAGRARGLLLLINNDAPDSVALLLEYLNNFRDLHSRGAVVIGVTKSDVSDAPSVADYSAALTAASPDQLIPVFTVDPRNAEEMRTLLLTLVASVEMRELLAPAPAPISEKI
ncbi:ATP/GTP-binding protein [Salinibacterium sp. SWN248]|uniref:GTP-binding protein n=1 Tax=Salinibacterium sp. SWN248 TaxID=2792056 RepID=UPI0018CF2C12|nr:ATP/GTP-binding protein [Salinibacterium sp. SWN248]MBH0022686.1 ATP/GTP-binding protein [Salinibacterium sp. SWN248]